MERCVEASHNGHAMQAASTTMRCILRVLGVWGGYGVDLGCLMGGYGGCEALPVKECPREMRFYKSPKQGLNLSRS